MKSAPMYAYRPTLEQAERLRQALAAASQANPERAEELQILEGLCQHIGDGIPEAAMDQLIDVILSRPTPQPDDLREELFGRLPDTIFEELGRLAALRALSERLVGTLLGTLGYTGDLERSPSVLFNLCEEQAEVLAPDLRQAVVENLHDCRDLARWQRDYELTVIHRYRTGKFDTEGHGLDSFDMDDAPGAAARTVMDLRSLIDRCEQARHAV